MTSIIFLARLSIYFDLRLHNLIILHILYFYFVLERFICNHNFFPLSPLVCVEKKKNLKVVKKKKRSCLIRSCRQGLLFQCHCQTFHHCRFYLFLCNEICFWFGVICLTNIVSHTPSFVTTGEFLLVIFVIHDNIELWGSF